MERRIAVQHGLRVRRLDLSAFHYLLRRTLARGTHQKLASATSATPPAKKGRTDVLATEPLIDAGWH